MSINPSTPSFNQIAALCASEYNLTGKISRMGGESNNYRIESPNGERYVLKIADDDLTSKALKDEYLIIEHVYAADIGVHVPRYVTTLSGSIEGKLRTSEGVSLRARLFDSLPGTPWYLVGEPNRPQPGDLGTMLGLLNLSLAEFDHSPSRRSHPWDLTLAAQHRDKATFVRDPARRRILECMFHLYAACTTPRLENLPHTLIHGDVNDENVLVVDGQIASLLDFSDCIFNPTICELGISLAYFMLEKPDPLKVGAEIVANYHKLRPISVEELAVLFPLICGRLCTTVSITAARRSIDPHHPNWFVTEERAWRLLERLYTIDPVEVTAQLAAEIDIHPQRYLGASVEVLIDKRGHSIGPSLSIAYDKPLKMVRGEGQYLIDHRGRPFLDLVNNVCHVGHCHHRVVQAAQLQMARLNTNTRYLYDGLTEYAERLCATLPDPLDTCFFVTSGSEANELALRLAMTYTGRRDILVVDGAYHGHTTTLIDISPY